MKKVITLLFVAILLNGSLFVQKTSATSHNDLFEEWKDEFQEQICPECKNPEEPIEPAEPVEPEKPIEPEEPAKPAEPIVPVTPATPEKPVETEEPVKSEKRKASKCKGSIGNLVWFDENQNGIQDNGEKGIDDVKLTLKWAGKDYKWGNDDDEELTTHTNKNGRYEFDDLCEGDYKIYVRGRDVAAYTQVYDPDGKPNNKAKVYLDGNKDNHTKADFGYIKRNTPATGAGILAILLAITISLLSFLSLKQVKKILY